MVYLTSSSQLDTLLVTPKKQERKRQISLHYRRFEVFDEADTILMLTERVDNTEYIPYIIVIGNFSQNTLIDFV